MVSPLIQTRSVMDMLLNMLQLSAKNLFIQFQLLPLCFNFAKIASQTSLKIGLPNWVLWSLMILLRCSWTNLNEATAGWSTFLTTVFLSQKYPVLYPRLFYKLNEPLQLRFAHQLMTFRETLLYSFQKHFFVLCVLIFHLKSRYRIDQKLRILERFLWLLFGHECWKVVLFLGN